MTDDMTTSRDAHCVPSVAAATVMGMSTTLLTKRRAVDHCRVHSALCRAR
jgi:hypothetical protein